MIFEQWRLKTWRNRLKHRKKILSFPDPVSMQERIEGATRICICMPKDHKYFYEARDCIQEIRSSKYRIMLVLSRELELLAEHHGKTEVYPQHMKKPFPVPESSVRNIPSAFDIAIDLSPQPTPLSAYITGTRGKKLTIGLESGVLDPFYTVLVKPGENYQNSVMTMLQLAGLVEHKSSGKL